MRHARLLLNGNTLEQIFRSIASRKYFSGVSALTLSWRYAKRRADEGGDGERLRVIFLPMQVKWHRLLAPNYVIEAEMLMPKCNIKK